MIDAVESGASRHEAAERFEVSVSSSVRWLQAWRKDRRATPKPRGGSVSPLEDHAAQILALQAENPDRSLLESVSELSKRRIKTSKSALSRFFLRHGITYKKSLQAVERERADVARARRRWIREQGMFEPARLVFIDETSINTSMTRLRGRSPRGEPLIDRVPMAHWTTITFVAALRHDKMVAPMVIEGAINAESFRAYVTQFLVPTLKRNDIVILDHLQAHKTPGVQEAIERAGATLRYLPQYSPDLNPIETPFHSFKEFLRKVAARSVRSLYRAIRCYLRILSPQEIANHFRHAGYASL